MRKNNDLGQGFSTLQCACTLNTVKYMYVGALGYEESSVVGQCKISNIILVITTLSSIPYTKQHLAQIGAITRKLEFTTLNDKIQPVLNNLPLS